MSAYIDEFVELLTLPDQALSRPSARDKPSWLCPAICLTRNGRYRPLRESCSIHGHSPCPRSFDCRCQTCGGVVNRPAAALSVSISHPSSSCQAGICNRGGLSYVLGYRA
jgi:hypothetical protein